MATIVLSAAGMALGGSVGGSVLGLSMATIGRAAGAVIGRRIDQQVMGGGSEPVETGRVDRFRLTGASEGTDLQTIYGRMRVPGQVIWASQFRERTQTTGGGGGGKGTPPAPAQPYVTSYSYSVSMALALGEGPVARVGRIWADGAEVSPEDLNMRFYPGSADQLPDPKIVAVEGAANTPAYRGTCYVVFEDLELGQFGNRIPQFTFEVMRPTPADITQTAPDLDQLVKGVALIPGTGEYALATTPVYLSQGFGKRLAINTNSPMGGTDFTVSMNALEQELPACKSVVVVVSWFGDDLRCGECSVQPKIEQREVDSGRMPWTVGGETRYSASVVPQQDDKPIYGGTPADQSVIEAIRDMNDRGLSAMFYPFILMEQLEGNMKPNPWTGTAGQPPLPWRGRITTSLAPTQSGTPDGTAAAVAEIDAFMGQAAVSDFSVTGEAVLYTGPNDWGYRRFILHYAHLCAAAGGVSAFCIGSEMRSLTQIRGPGNSFPAVAALQQLAADVRAILGAGCKISYAADWSEYHGYQPVGTGDKFFHLDPLWADPNIDFIGIDNYMPLSDWRDEDDHADSEAGSIYNLDYLRTNVAGGEGYDWYYPSPEARAAQRRVPITDGAGEPWVWRYKDFAGWWGNPHHDRINGVRQAQSTPWVPQSKPIWFTEFGCVAMDKGTNQPNKFIDEKSSESSLPYFSTGNRDDFIQMQYIRAVTTHYADPANNPRSELYDAPMVATDRMHVWAWDARPYPFFPGNRSLWSDGVNHARGHWLNGRATNRSLATVVAEVCQRSGLRDIDVSELHGIVRGYSVADVGSARAALQPLMITYGFDAVERGGKLVFKNRHGRLDHRLDDECLAINAEQDRSVALTRNPTSEIAGRVQLNYLSAEGDYDPIATEAIHPDDATNSVTRSEVSLSLTRNEGRQTVDRWIQETRIARDTVEFALPPSQCKVNAGDTVSLQTVDHAGCYRVDRVEEAGLRLIEATRIDPEAYRQQRSMDESPVLKPFVGPVPVDMFFMDLPLITGDEMPTSPHVAAAGAPWPGSVALYGSSQDSGYVLQDLIRAPSTVGLTQTTLLRGPAGIWDRQADFTIELINGALSSASVEAVLNGANSLAIGDGTADLWEVVQFQTATALGDNRFALNGLLRGQAGSRGVMPDVWPEGSVVVLLDGTPEQIAIPSAARGNTRHYRYGPTKSTINSPAFKYASYVFQGNGLRPYPVAHLRADVTPTGLTLNWIRCTRIDGDLWADADVPLSEETEQYMVRVIQTGAVRRQETTTSAQWSYASADATAEVGTAPFRVEVAQMSARYGAGPYTDITLQV
ncbi:baseplate multidomain protein megatron [Yoonia sediminilitoris]|uniref:Putative tail protein n=1 Tax=Yoonia sediminilitoris TaxID=1286148 RepID=A0A2T6KDP7_9RHOB|nr:glycoside hydrolase TIM-barrel-like domain-containing protein [Yoonia sediminilitoris]PUB13121.1 putative tail protein [Yoonia sediminilitoris]RCW94456.1 putative tail protein [Yoonia sediminilitoris]